MSILSSSLPSVGAKDGTEFGQKLKCSDPHFESQVSKQLCLFLIFPYLSLAKSSTVLFSFLVAPLSFLHHQEHNV